MDEINLDQYYALSPIRIILLILKPVGESNARQNIVIIILLHMGSLVVRLNDMGNERKI